MLTRLFIISCLLCSCVGCAEDIGTIAPLFVQNSDGGTCAKPPDLAQAPASCAAAKGLSGDILGGLCLDMDKIDTQGLTNRGFTFLPMNCGGWEVAAGKLQPKSINTAGGLVNCGLSLPNIPVDAKYSRVTLALIHQANLPSAMQQAVIELPALPSPLRIWVNPTTTVDQRTILELDPAKIPSGRDAQASIQLGAPKDSAMPSWTISSIAVLGNP